jgi:hypothetical protein
VEITFRGSLLSLIQNARLCVCKERFHRARISRRAEIAVVTDPKR